MTGFTTPAADTRSGAAAGEARPEDLALPSGLARLRRLLAVLAVLAVGALLVADEFVADEPGRETVERGMARGERVALPLPDRPSVAVLPFDALGASGRQAELVDGFAGTLVSALAAIPSLFVIASASTAGYAPDAAPRAVALR